MNLIKKVDVRNGLRDFLTHVELLHVIVFVKRPQITLLPITLCVIICVKNFFARTREKF